jgi:hypothetical protein
MAQTLDRIFGLADVADILSLSDARVRQLIDAGQLAATKISGAWVVRESDVVDFCAKDRRAGRPRMYEVVLHPAESTAHIGSRGGGLNTLCGLSPSAAIVHRLGETSDLAGTTMCSDCCAKAPRYVVRYWRSRGVG